MLSHLMYDADDENERDTYDFAEFQFSLEYRRREKTC